MIIILIFKSYGNRVPDYLNYPLCYQSSYRLIEKARLYSIDLPSRSKISYQSNT